MAGCACELDDELADNRRYDKQSISLPHFVAESRHMHPKGRVVLRTAHEAVTLLFRFQENTNRLGRARHLRGERPSPRQRYSRHFPNTETLSSTTSKRSYCI